MSIARKETERDRSNCCWCRPKTTEKLLFAPIPLLPSSAVLQTMCRSLIPPACCLAYRRPRPADQVGEDGHKVPHGPSHYVRSHASTPPLSDAPPCSPRSEKSKNRSGCPKALPPAPSTQHQRSKQNKSQQGPRRFVTEPTTGSSAPAR